MSTTTKPPIVKEACIVRYTEDDHGQPNGAEVYDLSLYKDDSDLTLFDHQAKVGDFTADDIQWLSDEQIIDLCQ